MIYLKKFTLPSDGAELGFFLNEVRTCFHTNYPFKIFPQKGLRTIAFENITMFYGGNGSGKSTLINVIARKMNAARYSEFNSAPFFDRYVDMCSLDYARIPRKSCVLSSDDVFDYALNARAVNGDIDERRHDLIDEYKTIQDEARRNPDIWHMKGLSDYDRWRKTVEILSPRRSQSSYVKKGVTRDIDLHSNGETAMRYFFERIEENAVYFLDEPENSLSIARQIELAEYIRDTARATQSQFIIATHSPIFLSVDGAKIYNLDDYPVSVCKWTALPNVRRFFDFFMERREEFL